MKTFELLIFVRLSLPILKKSHFPRLCRPFSLSCHIHRTASAGLPCSRPSSSRDGPDLPPTALPMLRVLGPQQWLSHFAASCPSCLGPLHTEVRLLLRSDAPWAPRILCHCPLPPEFLPHPGLPWSLSTDRSLTPFDVPCSLLWRPLRLG